MKNQIENFPEEVIEAMLDEQVRQGNKRDVTVFKNNKRATVGQYGFTWTNAEPIDGFDNIYIFWHEVINQENFDLFFKYFPKKEKTFPRVMYVSDNVITPKLISEGAVNKRVVFMKKNNKFLAWMADTLEKAEKELNTNYWNYAIDIDETNEIVELTIEDISKGKGVGIPPHLIRIKK